MKTLFYILCFLLIFPVALWAQAAPKTCRVKTLTVVPSDSDISLHWKISEKSNCSKIIIYRKSGISLADRNNKNMEKYKVLPGEAESYVDTAVNPGIFYFYSIGGQSPQKTNGIRSPVRAGIVKDITPPHIVSNFQAQLDKKSTVKMHWKQVLDPDVVTYQIYRGVDQLRPLQPIGIVSKNQQLFYEDKVDPLSPFAFIYAVTAIDGSGNEGPMSKTVTIVVPDKRAPEKPFITKLEPTSEYIILHWSPSPSPDVAGYNLYRSADNWKTRLKLNQKLVPENQFHDDAIEYNQVYSYYVTAVDKAGNESKDSGSYSCRSLVKIDVLPPEKIKLRKTKLGQPVLVWKDMGKNVRGYLVERRPEKKKGFRQVSPLLKNTVFEDSSTMGWSKIEYRLRALYINGELSAPSPTVLWQAKEKQGGKK